MTFEFVITLVLIALVASSTLSCVLLMKREEVSQLASWSTAFLCTFIVPLFVFAAFLVAVLFIDRGQHITVWFGRT